VLIAFLALPLGMNTAARAACPFCSVVEPTLSQRREAAEIVLVAELIGHEQGRAVFKRHLVLRGNEHLPGNGELQVAAHVASKPGALCLLMAEGASRTADNEVGQPFPSSSPAAAGQWSWRIVPVTETSLAYFLRAPSLRVPAAERLKYFARYLEHADPLVAEDAYAEFGYAPFEDVAAARDALDSARLRRYLVDEAVPQRRKGLYALALGLEREAAQRQANLQLLHEQIVGDTDGDFRAGFDGVLAGYLLLSGVEGLALIEQRYFDNPQASAGDVRHAMAALRFHHAYADAIPRPRLCEALRRLLRRPEFAAAAIADLARFQDWVPLDAVAALFHDPAYRQADVLRAIVGYLHACPAPAAAEHLARLRAAEPRLVAEAERTLQSAPERE
jgi:hypothetical protein